MQFLIKAHEETIRLIHELSRIKPNPEAIGIGLQMIWSGVNNEVTTIKLEANQDKIFIVDALEFVSTSLRNTKVITAEMMLCYAQVLSFLLAMYGYEDPQELDVRDRHKILSSVDFNVPAIQLE